MPKQPRYDEVVRCLDLDGYEVLPYPPGYIVRNRIDPTDVSLARDLDDLVDLAELFEWVAHPPRHEMRK